MRPVPSGDTGLQAPIGIVLFCRQLLCRRVSVLLMALCPWPIVFGNQPRTQLLADLMLISDKELFLFATPAVIIVVVAHLGISSSVGLCDCQIFVPMPYKEKQQLKIY